MYINGIGSHGVIFQIGGNHQNVTNTTDITSPRIESLVSHNVTLKDLRHNSNRWGQLPMDEIDVFDVASYFNASTPDGTWYKQTTSGDTPEPRIDFCLISASAPDGSSHNMSVLFRLRNAGELRQLTEARYLYGGRGADAFFDDIWVLSIPSFTWTKIYQGESPRFGHSCHRVGNRTMITVGGATNDDWDDPPCDWETKGVGVFDLSDLIWGSGTPFSSLFVFILYRILSRKTLSGSKSCSDSRDVFH